MILPRFKEVPPLDYSVYLAPPDHDYLGDGEKVLTAPYGRDTINTTEARQTRGKGWLNMTTTLYITRTGDMIQTGKPAEVTLEEYPEISRT